MYHEEQGSLLLWERGLTRATLMFSPRLGDERVNEREGEDPRDVRPTTMSGTVHRERERGGSRQSANARRLSR